LGVSKAELAINNNSVPIAPHIVDAKPKVFTKLIIVVAAVKRSSTLNQGQTGTSVGPMAPSRDRISIEECSAK